MSLVQNLKEFVIKNRTLVITVLSVLILGGGSIYAWKKYTYAQSPEAYVEKLNLALLKGDLAALAFLIDFRPMTESMARILLDTTMPSKESTPAVQSKEELAEKIQKTFIENIQNRDAKVDTTKQDPLASITPLPHDFIKQIAGNVSLLGTSQEGAIISIKFNHPRLEKDFQLHFLIKEKPDWKIVKFINFSDLLQIYIKEELALEKGRKKIFEAKRAEDQKRMKQQFRMDECTAFIHRPSGQKFSTLSVRIRGYNKGPFIIRNMTFDTKVVVESSGGQLFYNHNINTASRILVGTTLEDSYNMELRPEDESTSILEQAPKLSCEANVIFMTLDNGKALFVAPDESIIRKPLQDNEGNAKKK